MLPAGPTVVDMPANSAFYCELLRTRADDDDRPIWTKLIFAAGEHNFLMVAQHDMDAGPGWARGDTGRAGVAAVAGDGRRRVCVAGVCRPRVRDRFLAVIEGRRHGRNGSAWQVATVHALQERGRHRHRALAEM